MDRDAVDLILEQWNKERPDVDVSSMGVLGRLNRASRLASLDVQKFMNRFGLEPWEFDVLATLRRSAPEAPLTPGPTGQPDHDRFRSHDQPRGPTRQPRAGSS
jgi:hypothetical protein